MRQIQRFACVAIAAAARRGRFGSPAEGARQGQAGGERTRPRPRRPSRPRRSRSLPETKDAGIVAKGQVIETTFVVKNNGGSDLVISDARPGCGCTVASFDKVIKPGAEGKVVTSVDTKSFSGPDLEVGAPRLERPRARADQPLREGDRQAVRRHPPAALRARRRRQGRLRHARRDPPVRGEDLQADGRRVLAALREGGDRAGGEKDKIPGHPGEQYRVRITVTPDAPEGLLNAPVRIATGVAQQPTIEIPISGVVRARVSVTPVMVNFGNFTAGKDPITRNIVVTNNKPGTPVKVTKAEVSIAGFHHGRRPDAGGRLLHRRREGERQGEEGSARRNGEAVHDR